MEEEQISGENFVRDLTVILFQVREATAVPAAGGAIVPAGEVTLRSVQGAIRVSCRTSPGRVLIR